MKRHIHFLLVILFFVTYLFGCVCSLHSQEWQFVKEKEGIKIFTRREGGSSIKSFRGEAIFNTTYDKIASKLGTVNNFDWWDDDIRDIKVLDLKEGNYICYYLRYPLPWPLADRDLCARASIYEATAPQQKIISASPIPDAEPAVKGSVRIKNFYQKWDIQSIDSTRVNVVLEGYVDPGGAVPSWLYNMVITDTPLKVMRALRNSVEIELH